MKKWHFLLIILTLAALLAISAGATAAPPDLKVQRALGVTDGPDVHKVPVGSTVIHSPDGSTKVTGPDGKLVISAKSNEVALVPTPEGMAKATDVCEVPSGSFVHGASSTITEIYGPDGRLIITIVDQTGQASPGGEKTVPSYDHWIEDANWAGPGSFGYLYGEWTVPTAPSNSWIDDDVVYLFNAIEGQGANDWAGREVILQPVVDFNQNGIVPGNPLLGRVWVVSDTGLHVTSETIGVAVGNVIAGAVSLVDPNQPVWSASIVNQSTGQYSALTTDRLGTTGQFVTEALEGYNLEGDSDLFGTTGFVNLEVRNQNGGQLIPSWNGRIWPGAGDYFNNLGVIIYGSSHIALRTSRAPAAGGIKGLVGTTTGYPLPYAEVKAYEAGQLKGSGTTDFGGHYQISLPAGIYTVTASHDGFYDKTYNNVQVFETGFTIKNFQLTQISPGPIPI
jgi:hypothetical protein